MELSLSIFGATLALFSLTCYYYLRLCQQTSTAREAPPPEAGGARPITGHLHLMAGAQLPHFTLASLADRHGPIFTIRLGVRRALVVSSWELVKHLFTTCDVAVSFRPRLKASKHLSYDFAMFGFSPYGPYWRGLRKLISSEVLSSRRVELQRNVRVSETAHSMKWLHKVWEEESKDVEGRVLVDMKKWFVDLNLNLVLRVVTGKRFYGEDAEETRRCQRVFRDAFRFAGMFVPADALPFLGWLDIGGHEKKMKETAAELEKIVGVWLAEHREKEYSGDRDFMDVMLSVLQGGDQLQSDHYDADTIVKATCLTLISGGTDTTTVMLVWAMALLLNNRGALQKAQQELDYHVGKERRVDESDIASLVYLQAVVKETLRLYPAGPLGGTREFSENCNVGGYHVEKGTWLIVNLWKLHRDQRVWGDDALEFKPERFLSTHKDLDVWGQDFQLIPFGAGRRICPGSNLGVQVMHLVLANVLHAFELSTVSGEAVDMSESAGMTNMKATPLDVLVAPRVSPALYN